MYSNLQQATYRVKNGLISQWKWYVIFILWSCFIWFQNVKDFSITFQFYELPISVVDILIDSQIGTNFGLKICPFVCFIVLRSKINSLRAQSIIRYKTKTSFLITQILESAIYAFIFSVFQCTLITFMAISKGLPLICWDMIDNMLYLKTDLLLTESFGKVFGFIVCFFFLKCMMIFAVLDITLWISNISLLPWMLLIIYAGLELPLFKSKNINGFHSFFAVQYELWRIPWRHLLLAVIAITLIFLEYYIVNQLIKRKDLFRI